MLLPKINSRFLIITFLVFSSFWIYRIFKENLFAGIILVIATFLINFYWDKKNSFKIILVCILALLILQYKTTNIQNPTILDNDEQRVRQERLQMYPPTHINLGFKQIWFWPGIWIEQNKTTIILSRIEKNLFENLNLNKYFFGGTPRNSPEDFEKFTYFLLPVFILGIYKMISRKNIRILFILFIMPVALISVIGNKNNLGPIVLFPFFVLAFISGIDSIKKLTNNNNILTGGLILLIILGFILQINYAKI